MREARENEYLKVDGDFSGRQSASSKPRVFWWMLILCGSVYATHFTIYRNITLVLPGATGSIRAKGAVPTNDQRQDFNTEKEESIHSPSMSNSKNGTDTVLSPGNRSENPFSKEKLAEIHHVARQIRSIMLEKNETKREPPEPIKHVEARIRQFIQNETVPSHPVRLAHVTNLFACDNTTSCPELFRPLDQAQNVTIASMQRAMRESKKAIPTVYTAIFEADEYIVPDDIVTLSNRLTRSTMTQYPDMNRGAQKPLPFIDDILSSLYDSNNTKAFDYVIYSNSDIALHDDFYDQVAALIALGHDAFAINRRDIEKNYTEHDLYTGNDLDVMYKLDGSSHPGTDCFIFKKEYFRNNFHHGDIFLGSSPFGQNWRLLLRATSDNWRQFQKHEIWATFHLGEDRAWRKYRQTRNQNRKNKEDLKAELGLAQDWWQLWTESHPK